LLVKLYKAQKRSRRLQGRPKWQDILPDTKEQRDAYKIAAKNEDKFSRAFLAMTRSLIDDETAKKITDVWNKAPDIQSVMQLIPLFNEDPEEKVWNRFATKIEGAYFDVIEESGKDETKRINDKLKTNIKFTMDTPEDLSGVEIITKARVPVIPVNPFSKKWIKERALTLLKSNITGSQVEVIREILLGAFSEGLRGKVVIDQLKSSLGLTMRDFKAVNRRYALHLDAGLPKKKINILVGKYKDKLISGRAKTIARTETIAAQAQGRNATWQLAKDTGQLPETKRVWITAPSSPNPNRPCEICEDLDGREAAVDGAYESTFLGQIQMPPAHPNCRCTETLIRVKK